MPVNFPPVGPMHRQLIDSMASDQNKLFTKCFFNLILLANTSELEFQVQKFIFSRSSATLIHSPGAPNICSNRHLINHRCRRILQKTKANQRATLLKLSNHKQGPIIQIYETNKKYGFHPRLTFKTKSLKSRYMGLNIRSKHARLVDETQQCLLSLHTALTAPAHD